MACQCRFVSCHKCTTPVGAVDNGGDCAYGGGKRDFLTKFGFFSKGGNGSGRQPIKSVITELCHDYQGQGDREGNTERGKLEISGKTKKK